MMDESNDTLVESGEDEEVMTAAEVLEKIEELWRMEKMSPTLEPHHSDLVECMLDQLHQMSNNLKKCKKSDFRLAIHKLEIDRIRYIISSYLRTRVKKIERYAQYLLKYDSENTGDKPPLLSPEEQKYAKEYVNNMENHFTNLACRHMPENLNSLDEKKMIVKPNLESYVFLKVKKDVAGLIIEDTSGEGRDEEVDLGLGEQHLMRYDTVSHLLAESSVALI